MSVDIKRGKKVALIVELEKRVKRLICENKQLQAELTLRESEIEMLDKEVEGLSNEIDNRQIIIKDLALLVRHLCNGANIKAKAMSYLERKDLLGSMLRNNPTLKDKI